MSSCSHAQALHPSDPGYTYDIERNPLARITMTPDSQCQRFDRVLIQSPVLSAVQVELLGTAPVSSCAAPSAQPQPLPDMGLTVDKSPGCVPAQWWGSWWFGGGLLVVWRMGIGERETVAG